MEEIVSIIQTENLNKVEVSSRNSPIKAFLFDAGDILYHRPRRGVQFNEFLDKNGILDKNKTARQLQLKQLAYHGELSREDYFGELIKSYGISDPDLIEEGKGILHESDNDIVFFEGVYETSQTIETKRLFIRYYH